MRKLYLLFWSVLCCLTATGQGTRVGADQFPVLHFSMLKLPGLEIRAIEVACKQFSTQAHISCDSKAIQTYYVEVIAEKNQYLVTFAKPNRFVSASPATDYFYKVSKSDFSVKRYFPM